MITRSEYIIIGLRNHAPSEDAFRICETAFKVNKNATLSSITIKTNFDMRDAIKSYKFTDVPVLIDVTSKKKSYWKYYYGSELFDKADAVMVERG